MADLTETYKQMYSTRPPDREGKFETYLPGPEEVCADCQGKPGQTEPQESWLKHIKPDGTEIRTHLFCPVNYSRHAREE